MTLPASVASLVRARRVPVVPPAAVDRQLARIDTLRRQHKSVDAELATLRIMRAAQLVPVARGNRRSSRQRQEKRA